MKSLLLGCGLFISFFASAQTSISLKVKDKGEGETLPAVTILADSVFAATTDNAGVANVSLSDGRHLLSFLMTGYKRYDTVIAVPGPARIDIQLVFEEKGLEEVTIVASTRNNQSIENSPLKVEVLGPEEMSEEASIKPGNIASILGDVSGIQIQQTSATTGNSNVRIQGLEGRYTQILRDGMPLYDGFSGSFGILTIPPLDLKQIELIKGSASTLYGGGAIGGLINLISKRPTYDQTLDALLNYTTLKEFNANLFTSKRNDKVGYTLFAGYNRQDAVDVNGDGFSDVPNSQSVIVHPRLFWYPNSKTMVSVGYSGAFDTRDGGDMKVLEGDGDNVHRYHELNISQRNTGEYIVEHTSDKGARYTFKGTASDFNREQDSYNKVQGSQISYYSEASAMFPFKEDNLVAGVNVVGDDYKTIKPTFASLQSFSNFTAGVFGQYSMHIKEHTIVEGGIRFDHHNRYGLLVLPRIAAFHRFSDAWAARAGFGMGYKTPNPLVQQNIDYSPLVLLPLTDVVKPEISYGYNAEVNYTHKWGDEAKLFINQAFFLTQVQRPIMFEGGMYGGIVLVNAKYPLLSAGSDTYVKLDIHHWELYAGYTYTEPQNDNLMSISQGYIPLTPKHRFAFVLAKEIAEEWRIGIEGSYTGFQYRYDGTTTPGYWFFAAMVQRNIGKHVILVLNGENLLDYRMSKVEALYTGSVSDPVFKPLWAPIDGRAINFSVRYKL